MINGKEGKGHPWIGWAGLLWAFRGEAYVYTYCDVVLELREQPDCHDEEIRNLIPLNTDNFEIVQPCK